MTRCLAIACLVAALAGAVAPVPAGDPPEQPALLADAPPPGGEPPDPGTGGSPPSQPDPPSQPEPPPAAGGPNAENNSGMTCC